MSRFRPHFPEPTFPENELIRAADALPELSSGLRSATLVGCQTQILRAKRFRQLKMTSIAVVAASAVFAVWSVIATSTDGSHQPLVQDSNELAPTGSRTFTPSSNASTGSVFAAGSPSVQSEQQMIDESIEDITRRAQKVKRVIDAAIVRGF